MGFLKGDVSPLKPIARLSMVPLIITVFENDIGNSLDQRGRPFISVLNAGGPRL